MLRSLRSGNRGGLEDARRGATPTSNQQSQPQDPTPQLDRRIVPKDQSPGTGGVEQNRGGRRRGEEAQETPEELSASFEKRERLRREEEKT